MVLFVFYLPQNGIWDYCLVFMFEIDHNLASNAGHAGFYWRLYDIPILVSISAGTFNHPRETYDKESSLTTATHILIKKADTFLVKKEHKLLADNLNVVVFIDT